MSRRRIYRGQVPLLGRRLPLTFRAVIVSGKAKINLDYAVQVSK